MPVSGNTLAKYLVMVSQVIAWCTVSVMLLRRGMNQVNAAAEAVDDGGRGGNETAAADHRTTTARPFDGNGTPAVVAGVVMIAIAVIMLIVSPTIMLMKMLERRKRRMLDAELESPPKYEDVVESAPRYSSLFVFNNEGEMSLLPENVHQERNSDEKHQV